MLSSYREEQPYFVEEITKIVNKNKFSQAYLIETRNCQNANSIVLSFAKYLYCPSHTLESNLCTSCNLCSLIEHQINGDFVEIYPEGSFIKKRQILDIKEKFTTKSLDSQINRVYIIYEADKLNKESANTLLKFLEEPEENIIAILVTENRYKVIDTIRSRCQIFSLLNQTMEVEISDIELVTKIIECLEKKGRQSIAYLPITLENHYYNREQWITIFTNMQYIYEQAIRELEEFSFQETLNTILTKILEKNNEQSLLYKLEVIHNKLQELEYNLNINLMLDDFIIKFTE